MDVSRLQEKLRKIKKEISEIQNKCVHKKQEIKFIDYKEGVRWVCKNCNKALGWLTDREREKWSK